MTDKRARLDGIRARCNTVDTYWLITELEAAWGKIDSLEQRVMDWMGKVDISDHEGMRWMDRAEAAEKRVKRLEEALNSMARVASRGHVPDDVFDAMARIRSAALEEKP